MMRFFSHLDVESRFRYAVCLFVYAFSAMAFSFLDADTDLWGHIQFGKEIWEKGLIPKLDSYSYTANGFPWINHEWLTELTFYLFFFTIFIGAFHFIADHSHQRLLIQLPI